MAITAIAGAVLLGASALLMMWRSGVRARVRLRRLGPSVPTAMVGRRRRVDPARWLPLAAGLSAGIVIGGWLGVAGGVAVAIGLRHAVRHVESRAARQARLAAAAELPFAIDLLAASLQAGSAPALALRAVGATLSSPLGERLCRVAREMSLGASPPDAWAHLRGVPGAGRVTAAAMRSSQSGAALAGGFTRLADELRAARGLACEAAARRAGVLVVLPLGLCFLPAFVLAGLAPVVLAVIGEVMP